MNIPNEHDAGNFDEVGLQGGDVASESPRDKPLEIAHIEFYGGVAVNHPSAVQGVVTEGLKKIPNEHRWCKLGINFPNWAAEKVWGFKPAYLVMGAFNPDAVSARGGRSGRNAVAFRGLWIDVEASAEKYERHPDGGYPNGKAALVALSEFVKAGKLTANYIVFTGSGGFHLHFVLDKPIAPDVWIDRARALVALAQKRGFKIDAQCTTDAARIMRAPGSIHQKTDKLVRAFRWRVEPYTLNELDSLMGYSHDTSNPLQLQSPTPGKYDVSANQNALMDYHKYSYVQAAQKCGAMHKAALRNGVDTPYPVWILALKTAALSIEGLDYAHEISCGHPDYDQKATDRKIDSLKGGPAGCKAWADAYGAGGPCDTCEHGEH